MIFLKCVLLSKNQDWNDFSQKSQIYSLTVWKPFLLFFGFNFKYSFWKAPRTRSRTRLQQESSEKRTGEFTCQSALQDNSESWMLPGEIWEKEIRGCRGGRQRTKRVTWKTRNLLKEGERFYLRVESFSSFHDRSFTSPPRFSVGPPPDPGYSHPYPSHCSSVSGLLTHS